MPAEVQTGNTSRMTLAAFFFYVFSIVTIASGVMVISVRNPVHAVLFLILAFFNAAGLFVLLGAEFLAMILVIVYVGAVAVLFLFVVMMLDVDFAELRTGFTRMLPVALAVGGLLMAELIFVAGGFAVAPGAIQPAASNGVTNAEALGRVLYTDYVYFFQLAGLTLLIAMIGAIVLTLRIRDYAKRQDAGVQMSRRQSEAMALVEVETGKGIS